ncbi:general odorant-binding protein 56d-like [Condylostylus longicornis]|uniref:general odorant-binding protein 56d-like n=1 Tax=Condylostylus longicornis TaxID=2530218 RepID=UPI00244DA2C3|nr:general odorant-binding protein 56d-like [Condylostylus longicornis]
MKPLIFLLPIILFYSLVFCEADFDLLEEAYSNCTQENDVTPDLEELIKNYNFSQTTESLQCYWKCFMETTGNMLDGKIIRDEMCKYLESQIVYGLYDEDDIKRLFEFCEKAVLTRTKGESDCEMSYELSKCIYLNLIGEHKIVGNIK